MNFKKSKIRSLVLLALAAVAFCGLIWFANKDRPVYRSSNMAGTDYEVGRVLRVVEDHKTVDEEMDGICPACAIHKKNITCEQDSL